MSLKEFKNKYNLSDLEMFKQNISTHKLSFFANKLKEAESTHSDGTAARLIKNKKIGFASSYGHCNPEDLILKGLETTKYSNETDIELPGKESKERKKQESKENKNNNHLKDFKEKGSEIIETIQEEAQGVLIDVFLKHSFITQSLENSRDLNFTHSKDIFSLSINLRETLENDFIEIFTSISDSKLPKPEKYINEVLKYYKLSKHHAHINHGHWPVLFTSKASKELLNIIEDALNGKEVIYKSTPWHNKLGAMVLSKSLTLKQNPSFGYMARDFDDEGNIVKPLVLIENGILKNFYFDLLTAHCRGLINQTPTGNGFKPSLSSQPEPSLLNMIVSCGKRSLEEMIKDIDYGLLVDQTIGGLTTNISGNMSVNIDIGFLIEKGELIGRVKDTMISGNIYRALNNLIELSNNPQWLWSNIYSPDMLLDGFALTAK